MCLCVYMYNRYNVKLQAVKATINTTLHVCSRNRTGHRRPPGQPKCSCPTSCKQKRPRTVILIEASFYLSPSSTQATSMNKSCLEKRKKKKLCKLWLTRHIIGACSAAPESNHNGSCARARSPYTWSSGVAEHASALNPMTLQPHFLGP